jgi:hypothetical protein
MDALDLVSPDGPTNEFVVCYQKPVENGLNDLCNLLLAGVV